MRLFIFALVYLNFFLLASGACPNGYTVGNNNVCYKTYASGATWYQAEQVCYQAGGHLASASDAYTNAFIAGLANKAFNGQQYWLGGTTNFLGGNWAWTDFSNFTYANWAAGKKNDVLGCSLTYF